MICNSDRLEYKKLTKRTEVARSATENFLGVKRHSHSNFLPTPLTLSFSTYRIYFFTRGYVPPCVCLQASIGWIRWGKKEHIALADPITFLELHVDRWRNARDIRDHTVGRHGPCVALLTRELSPRDVRRYNNFNAKRCAVIRQIQQKNPVRYQRDTTEMRYDWERLHKKQRCSTRNSYISISSQSQLTISEWGKAEGSIDGGVIEKVEIFIKL